MIHAFVNSRSGSKRLKDKNIKNFCNKPLAYWTLKVLEESIVNQIFYLSDSIQYINLMRSFNFTKVKFCLIDEVDDYISQDEVNNKFISENYKEYNINVYDDVYLLKQITNPFISKDDINNAIQKWRNNYTSLITTYMSKDFLYQELPNGDVIPINFCINHRPRKQKFVNQYYCDAGALCITAMKDFVITGKSITGRLGMYIIDSWKGIDIDDEEDFILAEKIAKKHKL